MHVAAAFARRRGAALTVAKARERWRRMGGWVAGGKNEVVHHVPTVVFFRWGNSGWLEFPSENN